MSKAREQSRSTGRGPFGSRGRLRLAVLFGGLAAAQLVAVAARADEPVVIHVRGRSQLRLREGERAATSGGRFQLTVAVQLDDGQGRSDGEASDGATGAADPPGGGQKGAGGDPARSFAGQRIRLRLSGPDGELDRPLVTTGQDGRAVVSLGELPTGSYSVLADYAGDELRDPAHAELTVDLGRQPVQLALQVPAQVARRAELTARITLLSEERPFPAEVRLSIGELRRAVRLLGGFGQVAVPLRGLAGLRAGQSLAVIASFPGDRLHSSALVRRDVLLTSQARVTLELAAPAGGLERAAVPELAQGSTLTAVGLVSDEEGPLPGEPVDLELSEQPGGEHPGEPGEATALPARDPATPPPEPVRTRRALASGITDSSGRFRIAIQRLPLRPGPAVLAAQVTPRHSYILPARAAELPILILPPEPVSALYYVLPLLASVLGGLLWLLGRWLQPALARLGAALREARLLRGRKEPAAAASPPLAAAELATGEPGVSLSQGRRLAGLTLRRTVDTTLDGQVVDASFGRPVGGAAVTLQPVAAGSTSPDSDSKRGRTVQAGEDGRFTVSQLPAGRYLVEVTASGYLPQRFAAAVPHRGELRGVSVRLEPLRVRLLGQWQRVAQRLLGQESRLRTATPRELLEQFGRLRTAAAVGYGATARDLQRLTDLVEQAYYSPRVCTAEMLADATRLADAVLDSGAAPGVQLPPPEQAAGPPVPLS
jgi:hypothetical protein